MTARDRDNDDSDDFFAHTRMSLGDHIEELRTALFSAIKGFVVALILGFCLAQPATHFIARPIENELTVFYKARVDAKKKELEKQEKEDPNHFPQQPVRVEIPLKQMLEQQHLPSENVSEAEMAKLTLFIQMDKLAPQLEPALREFLRPPTLSALSVTEAFMVWLQVAIYIGFILASPWIFFQLWMFVAAGLYPTEKRLVHVYLPFSLGLFLVGVLVCEFVVLPIGIHYLLSFNQWMNIEPDLRLSEWLTFAILMPLVFGIAFQLPLVMFFLDRIGLLTVKTYLAYWRMAVFVILLLSAVLAVSPDPFSALAMAIPLWGLYFLGIWLCWVMPRAEPDLEVPDPEEMVEV